MLGLLTGSKILIIAARNFASCFGCVLHLAFASKISRYERVLIRLVDITTASLFHEVDALGCMRLPHTVIGKTRDIAVQRSRFSNLEGAARLVVRGIV
jgi:hypothetical protein